MRRKINVWPPASALSAIVVERSLHSRTLCQEDVGMVVKNSTASTAMGRSHGEPSGIQAVGQALQRWGYRLGRKKAHFSGLLLPKTYARNLGARLIPSKTATPVRSRRFDNGQSDFVEFGAIPSSTRKAEPDSLRRKRIHERICCMSVE